MTAGHKFYGCGYEYKRSHTKVTSVRVQIRVRVRNETLCGYDGTGSALWYGYEHNKYEVTYTGDVGTGTGTKSDDGWSSYTTSGTGLIRSGKGTSSQRWVYGSGTWGEGGVGGKS